MQQLEGYALAEPLSPSQLIFDNRHMSNRAILCMWALLQQRKFAILLQRCVQGTLLRRLDIASRGCLMQLLPSRKGTWQCLCDDSLCNGKACVSPQFACRLCLKLGAHACQTLQPSQALQQCQASCRPGCHRCKDFLRCKRACVPSGNSCQPAPIHQFWMIMRTW